VLHLDGYKTSRSPGRREEEEPNTHKLEHVPVEHVVVGEALAVEQVPEQLAQVRVVGLVVEAQGAAEVQVGGKLRCEGGGETGDQWV